MQKVSYMGNGTNTEFTFNFPYFENTDIIVTKNSTVATGYSLVGTSGGLDADIPYTGGKVVFETAPTSLDNITISRRLPLTRIVDYQPLEKIDPTTLNQDMNYMMEVLKDMQDDLDGFSTQYAEIVDKESTNFLLTQIAAVSQEINNISQQINALGDISVVHQSITTNAENITMLDTRTTCLLDYVIETQLPTAENNYTWYRKYRSGWIEQGGYCSGSGSWGSTQVILPVPMANAYYTLTVSGDTPASSDYTNNTAATVRGCTRSSTTGRTSTSFYVQSNNIVSWQVSGIAA